MLSSLQLAFDVHGRAPWSPTRRRIATPAARLLAPAARVLVEAARLQPALQSRLALRFRPARGGQIEFPLATA